MSQRQNISQTAGELAGQAQAKKDECTNQMSSNQSHSQDSSVQGQAANFLQQTGEQMKHMAQGAADAVKNTLGMNADNSSNNPNTGNTNNPSALNNTNNPSTNSSNNPSSISTMNNPSSTSTINNPSSKSTINNPSSNPSTRI